MSTEAPEVRLKRALWLSLVLCAVIVALVLVAVFFATRERIGPATTDLNDAAPILSDRADPVVMPVFSDVTQLSGISFRHVNGATGERLLPETMGGGVAFLDVENDGDQDLIFVNSKNWPWNESSTTDERSVLYVNRGDGSFNNRSSPILERPLYGMGIAVGDFDGDGFVDVFLTAVGKNRLLRNMEGERFVDVTDSMQVGGSDNAWSTCATFVDYDNDGDLDLFVCNYVEWSRERDQEVDYRLAGIGRAYGPPTDFAGTNSYLYRNDGDVFTDVTSSSGVEVFNDSTGNPVGKGLAVVVVDVNDDSWPDFVVANDTVRNFAFVNQGDGTFVEAGIELGIAFDTSGLATGAMGIDAAHYANTSSVAIAIGNFSNEMSSFFVRPEGQNSFSDDAIVSGIGAPSRRALTFGLVFIDYDLDGRSDIFAANGHVEPEINRVQSSQHYAQSPQIWWNCGSDCRRPYISVEADADTWGRPLSGRGVAYADIDGDGDLDVVVSQVGDVPVLLRNDTESAGSWVRISLRQPPPNVYALGAKVVLKTNLESQIRHVSPTRSYLSQVELPVTFGLGPSEEIIELSVHWPDGTVDSRQALETNKTHSISKH
ncbi:MAG: CRTAC1 family protein [Gammaproteobacteria bacterium]|nr:CRTAC1 family protein [Gammaproteobacteria bacterium]